MTTIKRILAGRRFRWITGTLAGLFILYLLLGYFAVDPLAKKLLPWVAENKLTSKISVDKVAFDPLRLHLTVDNLKLTRNDGQPLAGFKQLFVDLEADGLFRRAWHISDIRLTEPSATLEIGRDGKLNWDELIAKVNEDPSPESDTIPRLLLDHILIEKGNLHYAELNRDTPFVSELAPLELELGSFSTLPQERGNYEISALVPKYGTTLRWKGTFGANPLSSTGDIQLEGLKLARLEQAAGPEMLPVSITDGDLGVTLHYDFSMVRVPGQPEPKPQAILSKVALNMTHLAAQLNPQTKATMEQFNATLPQLDLALQRGGHINMQGLQVQADKITLAQSGKNMLALEKLNVSDIAFSVADNKLDIAKILLEQGEISALRDKSGAIDWASVAPASAAAPEEETESESATATPLRFAINDIRLEQWKVDFKDETFVKPLRLNVGDINLALAAHDDGQGVIADNIELLLGKLALYSPLSPQPVARIEQINLTKGAISLTERKAELGGLITSGLETSVSMDAQKKLNWVAMLQTVAPPKSASAASSAKSSSDWKLALDTLRLEKAAIRIEDKSPGKPMRLDVQNGEVEARNVTLDFTKPIALKAGFRVKQGGRFSANGKLALAPLKGNIDLKLEGLALAPFSPYLNQQMLLKLTRGEATVKGKLSLKPAKTISGQFKGGFAVNNLVITEESNNTPFIQWKSVSSDSLNFSLAPNSLRMDELRVDRPVGSFIIFEDQTMNLRRMMRPSTTTATAAPAPAESGESFPINVSRVSITNADFEFADLSLRPQFGTRVHTLTGVINGLSTDPASAAQVELDGKVDDYGSARVRGALQPFRATENTDITLAFRNLEMSRLTPYSGKFAGRKIDSGKIAVDLEYKIKNRHLSGENKFVITSLKLGEHVDSPDAMNLPLDLAITLLEDSNGVIDLDLPISGDLDDPQFSYGKIVWKAITNIIGKIVTAPFRALGKLFGISSDKLDAVVFDPGEGKLLPPEKEKLKQIADAMAKKPTLALSISPGFDPVNDKTALQEKSVRLAVLKEMDITLGKGEQPGPIDLNNVKVQTAVENLHKDLKGESRSFKAVDAVRDYFRESKPEDLPRYEAMLKELKDTAKVSDDDLQTLATERAEAIRNYLVDQGLLAAERVSIGKAAQASGDEKTVPIKMELGLAQP
ncbi:MAG: DUF748 domain-containing protein [Methylobacillus sp.]|jgi:uncharacterized protein involved in outer membrane biogenesis|nr:DUF748 domain-containing protein [Methylobacillus sp.]